MKKRKSHSPSLSPLPPPRQDERGGGGKDAFSFSPSLESSSEASHPTNISTEPRLSHSQDPLESVYPIMEDPRVITSKKRKVLEQREEQVEELILEDPKDQEERLIRERRQKLARLQAQFLPQTQPLLSTSRAKDMEEGNERQESKMDSVPTTPLTPGFTHIPPSSSSLANSTEEGVAADDSDEEGQAAAEYDPQGGEAMKEAEKGHDQRFHPSLDDAAHVPSKNPTPTKALSMLVGSLQNGDEEEEDMDDMFADTPPPASAPKQQHPSSAPIARIPQPTGHIPEDDWDDADGYYRTVIGEALDSRYRVDSYLGKGVFSTVVRAYDTTFSSSEGTGGADAVGANVAIKIIRRNDTMRKAGLKEAGILRRLAKSDPEGRRHVIRLLRTFEHRGHLCLVFEALGYNLRQVLQRYGKGVGLHLHAVRSYAQQAFLALSLLTKVGIVHADIKPDNILVNESKTALRVCDLGSAFDPSDPADVITTPYLVSRFYRAPEIILGLPYDGAIDTWSMGCSLYELFTGRILFPGRTNNDMLRLHMELQGRFTFKAIRKGLYTQDHFDPTDKTFLSRETDRLTGKEVIRPIAITRPTKDLQARLLKRRAGGGEDQDPLLPSFVDFLQQCLSLSPEKRLTPKQALSHPFLRG